MSKLLKKKVAQAGLSSSRPRTVQSGRPEHADVKKRAAQL